VSLLSRLSRAMCTAHGIQVDFEQIQKALKQSDGHFVRTSSNQMGYKMG